MLVSGPWGTLHQVHPDRTAGAGMGRGLRVPGGILHQGFPGGMVGAGVGLGQGVLCRGTPVRRYAGGMA